LKFSFSRPGLSSPDPFAFVSPQGQKCPPPLPLPACLTSLLPSPSLANSSDASHPVSGSHRERIPTPQENSHEFSLSFPLGSSNKRSPLFPAIRMLYGCHIGDVCISPSFVSSTQSFCRYLSPRVKADSSFDFFFLQLPHLSEIVSPLPMALFMSRPLLVCTILHSRLWRTSEP